MTETTLEAESIPEFLGLVAEFTDLWFREEPTWGPWFRGETDATWRLRPKLYRDPQTKTRFKNT
jgi:hypothetical protein